MDDRLNGKVFTSSGPLSAPLSVRFFSRPGTCFRGVVFACAVGVSYRHRYVCSAAGKVLDVSGFIVDSAKQACLLPKRKIDSGRF